MKVGLIGFPQSGKTTIYNALTGQRAEIGFASRGGKANLGTVKVPDERIETLAEIFQPRKKTLAEIVFVDLPTAAGASSRSFDSNTIATMREVDAITLVVNGFGDSEGKPKNPLQELQDLYAELTLADLVPVEKRLERLKREKPQAGEVELLTQFKEQLENNQPLRSLKISESDMQRFAGYRFLTEKPIIVVLNVSEKDLAADLSPAMKTFLAQQNLPLIPMCGPVEMDISEMPKEDQLGFLQDLGLSQSATQRFIKTAYQSLKLISFLTAGEDECRAWTINAGTSAQKAAGKIHSDIERGFIRAEVMRFDDFAAMKSEVKMREAGKMRLEGKEYVVQDGDIINFRHAT